MAVTEQTPRNVSTAAPGATQFPYSFKIISKADLLVQVNGVTKTVDVDYTVDGVGQDAGGTVTFMTPLSGGETVVRKRNMRYERATDYQNLGDLRSATLNNDQDAPILMIQQLAEENDRALRLPIDTTASAELPAIQPLKPLVGKADGSGFEFGDTALTGDMLLRPDLASSATGKGAALVAVKQTGTGMAARTVAANNALAVNVMDAVDPDDDAAILAGTLDASTAVSAAIDEAIARGLGGIRFPAGRFLLNTAVVKTLTSTGGFSIEGAGMGLTQIICADASGDGLSLTAQAGDGNWWLNVPPSSAIRIANLSILATQLNLGTGLKINGNSLEGRPGAPVVLDHVEIRAKDSINGQAFLVGLHLHDCMSVLASHCRFLVGGTSNLTPTAVKIEATDATTDPVQTYFDNCEWFYGGKGIVASDYFEGLYLTNCTMAKCDVGVEWTATVGGGESGLHVVGGHWNCLTRNFDLNGVFDFAITGVVSFLSGGSPQAHIRTRNGGNFTITGNVFQAGTTGIDVGTVSGSARGGYIGSNQFSNQTTGIVLAADANNVRVGDNNYTNVTTRISGAGGTGATIAKRSYSVTTVVTLAGGAAYEDVNVAIPSGVFSAKPSVIVASGESSSQRIICFPVQTSASTTATNMVITVGKNDGTNLAAGAVRIHVVAFE